MSKAFTKETDRDEEDPERDAPVLPAGTKNYITTGGLKRLQDELHRLLHIERPEVTRVVQWAAENGDRSENADYTYGKKRLREIDRRVRFISKRLDNVEIVDPADPSRAGCEQIFFGATVTVRIDDEPEKRLSIVGVDEIDLERGRISWMSPLASALLRASVGDIVMFKSPRGEREVEILAVEYIPLV